MSTPSLSIQALIAGTTALNCEDLSTLETVPLSYPQQDSFCLIGRLLSPKPPSAYWVHEILTQVWKFACPFEVMDLPKEKYLFKLSQRSHMDKILDQGPWNVKRSLLILKTWSHELSFDEVELTFCPFWVQIHELPRHNMTAKNAAQIGCLIGSVLDVEYGDIDGIICTHHLRVKVKVDSSKPLAPGFYSRVRDVQLFGFGSCMNVWLITVCSMDWLVIGGISVLPRLLKVLMIGIVSLCGPLCSLDLARFQAHPWLFRHPWWFLLLRWLLLLRCTPPALLQSVAALSRTCLHHTFLTWIFLDPLLHRLHLTTCPV
jgi:hypothetical protein